MNAFVRVGEQLFAWLADASLQVGALVIVLLIVERCAGSWLTPRWRYALWMILMLRLALPGVPEIPSGGLGSTINREAVVHLLPAAGGADALARGDERGFPPPAVLPRLEHRAPATTAMPSSFVPQSASLELPASPARSTLTLRAASAWTAIAVAFALFGIALWRAVRFERGLLAARPVSDAAVLELFARCRERMGIAREVGLLESEAIATPALVGIRSPRVLLPAHRPSTLSGRSLELVLCHELAHMRGRDIEVGLFLLALRSCFWFHPLVWLASARLFTAREARRDWQALAARPGASPDAYARTLLALAESHSLGLDPHASLLPLHWNRTHELKRRIQMIHAFRSPSRAATVAGAGLAIALAWTSLTAAEQTTLRTTPAEQAIIHVERANELPAWRVALDRALAQRFDVSVKDVSLVDLLADLRKRTGINLVVQPEYLASYGETRLDLQLGKVTLEEVLEQVCLALGDGMHGIGLQAVTLGYDAGPPTMDLCIYQVRSLLAEEEEGNDLPDQLMTMVQIATATPDEAPWDQSGSWMQCWNGLLFVSQSSRVHARVEAFLGFLASNGSRPATPPEPWREPLLAALARPADIVVDRVPLGDVLAMLSAQHGISIQCLVDWAGEPVTLELHGVDLGTVLTWIGRQYSLQPRLSSGGVVLDQQGGELELCLYDLNPLYRSLPDTDPEEVRSFLSDLISNQVDPPSWDSNPLTTKLFWKHQMLVRQSSSAQRGIAETLAALERSLAESGAPPPPKKDPVKVGKSAASGGEIRVALYWDETKQQATRQFRDIVVKDDSQLLELIKGAHDECVRQKQPETPVEIDAAPGVPWSEIIRVVDLCKELQISAIQFGGTKTSPD